MSRSKYVKPDNGSVFGSWVVAGDSANKGGRIAVVCRCVCGTVRSKAVSDLVNGISKSCGCVNRSKWTADSWQKRLKKLEAA